MAATSALGRAVFGEVARHGVRVAQLERERFEPFGAPGREHHPGAGRVEHAREARTQPALAPVTIATLPSSRNGASGIERSRPWATI